MTPEELREIASRGEDEPWYGPSATFTEALTEAADTIERLQRENERLSRMSGNIDMVVESFNADVAHGYEKYKGMSRTLEREKSELEHQVAALRADAERYRWLRDSKFRSSTAHDRYPGYHWSVGLYDDDMRGVDAAIDSARTADAARDS